MMIEFTESNFPTNSKELASSSGSLGLTEVNPLQENSSDNIVQNMPIVKLGDVDFTEFTSLKWGSKGESGILPQPLIATTTNATTVATGEGDALLGELFEPIWNNAIAQIESFTQSDNSQKLQQALGDSWSPTNIETTLQPMLKGSANLKIEILPSSMLQSKGAFADANKTIYLSEELLTGQDSTEAVDVLLEELGHFADTQINGSGSDAPGDEGAIFSALVQGKSLSAEELAALQAEDDHAKLFLNEQAIAVEQAGLDDANGTFTVGNSGKVEVDYLFDGGGYEGEVAIFSLEGMDNLDIDAFIAEAAKRALSSGPDGQIIINDLKEGAQYSGELGERDLNKGKAAKTKVLNLATDGKYAFMMVPNGSIAEVLSGKSDSRPLFSIDALNPDAQTQFTQVADDIFAFEDLPGARSDRDFNDIIFSVKGVNGNASALDELVEPSKNWASSPTAQSFLDQQPKPMPEPPVAPPTPEEPTPEPPVAPPMPEEPTPEPPVAPPTPEEPTPEPPVAPPTPEEPTPEPPVAPPTSEEPMPEPPVAPPMPEEPTPEPPVAPPTSEEPTPEPPVAPPMPEEPTPEPPVAPPTSEEPTPEPPVAPEPEKPTPEPPVAPEPEKPTPEPPVAPEPEEPNNPPAAPTGFVSTVSKRTAKFNPSTSESAIAASNAPRIKLGSQTIYIGTQQVSSINKNPIIRSFDSENPANNWTRTDYEKTGADGNGFGLIWTGKDLYAVFSADGTQGKPSEDYRRASGDAKQRWLRTYGAGGGARVSVLGRIDPATGNLVDAAYLSTVLSSGKTNSLTVTGAKLNSKGNLVVTADAYSAPRRPDGTAMTKTGNGGSPFKYTAELTPDLSRVISTSAEGWA